MFSREFMGKSPIVGRISPGPCRVFPRSSPTVVTPTAGVADTGAMEGLETGPGASRFGAVGGGLAVEDWTGDARFHEYSAAVDPIGSGRTSRVPIRCFRAAQHG